VKKRILRSTLNLRQPLRTLPNRLSIIPRIRHPYNRMRMVLRRLRIRQENTRMVIQLDQNHWTLNPEIERVVIAETANPTEIRFVEMSPDLLEFKVSGIGRMVE
jgi:hypothetical protein